MAASACADGVKRIQSADSDRKRKKYNWHSILAAAMDETLNCVEAAWARNLPGPAR
jgi:hypothetical protein